MPNVISSFNVQHLAGLMLLVSLAIIIGCPQADAGFRNSSVGLAGEEGNKWGRYKADEEAIVLGTITSIQASCPPEFPGGLTCGDDATSLLTLEVTSTWTESIAEGTLRTAVSRNLVSEDDVGLEVYLLLRATSMATYCGPELSLVALDANVLGPGTGPGPDYVNEVRAMEGSILGPPVAAPKSTTLEEFLNLEPGTCETSQEEDSTP